MGKISTENGGKPKRKHKFVIVRDNSNGRLNQRLKRAAELTDSTVTDIVLDAVGGAVRKIEDGKGVKRNGIITKVRTELNRTLDAIEQEHAN